MKVCTREAASKLGINSYHLKKILKEHFPEKLLTEKRTLYFTESEIDNLRPFVVEYRAENEKYMDRHFVPCPWLESYGNKQNVLKQLAMMVVYTAIRDYRSSCGAIRRKIEYEITSPEFTDIYLSILNISYDEFLRMINLPSENESEIRLFQALEYALNEGSYKKACEKYGITESRLQVRASIMGIK